MRESARPGLKEEDVIEVRRTGEGSLPEFEVVVREGSGETRDHVTMGRATCDRLTAGKNTPERCLEGDLPVAARPAALRGHGDLGYFPKFEQELPRYLLQS
jgi:hypothetical protein